MRLLQRITIIICTSILTALMVIGGMALLDKSADKTREELRRTRLQVKALTERTRLLEKVISEAGLEVPGETSGQPMSEPHSPQNEPPEDEPGNDPPNKPKPPKPPKPSPRPKPSPTPPEECIAEIFDICV